MKRFIVFLFFIYVSNYLFTCTIAVLSGRITDNGNPVIIKNRDFINHETNIIFTDSTGVYSFTGVSSVEDPDYLSYGINEMGLSIANSLSLDMVAPNGDENFNNIDLMIYTLKNFSSVEEFESFLIETNGNRSTRGNFAIMDLNSNAFIYEVSPFEYVKFDANDYANCPNGYIVRTNFSSIGGGVSGIERYNRANSILSKLSKNYITPLYLMKEFNRDFSTNANIEINVPYNYSWNNEFPIGYIDTSYSINNRETVSSVIIEQKNFDNDIKKTLMWTLLGNPSASMFVPIFNLKKQNYLNLNYGDDSLVNVSKLIKNELYDLEYNENMLQTRYLDSNISNFWQTVFANESIFYRKINRAISENKKIIEECQKIYAVAKRILSNQYIGLQNQVDNDVLIVQENLEIYPNPLNIVKYDILNIKNESRIEIEDIKLYDLKGRVCKLKKIDNYKIKLNKNLPSGIYLFKITTKNKKKIFKKFLIVR